MANVNVNAAAGFGVVAENGAALDKGVAGGTQAAAVVGRVVGADGALGDGHDAVISHAAARPIDDVGIIVADREAVEEPPPLGDEDDAEMVQGAVLGVADGSPERLHASAARLQHPAHDVGERRLARPVGAQDQREGPRLDVEIDVA